MLHIKNKKDKPLSDKMDFEADIIIDKTSDRRSFTTMDLETHKEAKLAAEYHVKQITAAIDALEKIAPELRNNADFSNNTNGILAIGKVIGSSVGLITRDLYGNKEAKFVLPWDGGNMRNIPVNQGNLGIIADAIDAGREAISAKAEAGIAYDPAEIRKIINDRFLSLSYDSYPATPEESYAKIKTKITGGVDVAGEPTSGIVGGKKQEHLVKVA